MIKRTCLIALTVSGSLFCTAETIAGVIVSSFTRSSGTSFNEGNSVTFNWTVRATSGGTLTNVSGQFRPDSSSGDTLPDPAAQLFGGTGTANSQSFSETVVFRDNGVASPSLSGFGVATTGNQNFSATMTPFQVLNVAPVLTSFQILSPSLASGATIFEGTTLFVSFGATDPGYFDDIEFRVNGVAVGTDTTDTIGLRTVTAAYVARQEGFFTGLIPIVGQAVDSDGALSNSISALNLRVLNRDPIITSLTPSQSRLLGDILEFNATALDPGLDPLSYAWDLDGDGFYDDYFGQTGQLALNTLGAHVFSVRVADDGGGFAVREFAVDVSELDVQSVPEPSSLALLASGIIGLGGGAWRRRRTAGAISA